MTWWIFPIVGTKFEEAVRMLLLGMILVNISCGAEKVVAEKMLGWWSFSSCAIGGKWVQLAENCGFCFRSHATLCVTELFGLTLTSYGSLDSATFTEHYKGRPLLPNVQSVALSCCLLFFFLFLPVQSDM